MGVRELYTGFRNATGRPGYGGRSPFGAAAGPLTASAVQAALLGGAGYGIGSFLDWMTASGEPRFRRSLGLAGLGLGVAPNLMAMGVGYRKGTEAAGGEASWLGRQVGGMSNLNWEPGKTMVAWQSWLGGGVSQGIPAAYTRGMILDDLVLDPMDKARAIAVIDEAGNGPGLLTPGNIARAAVGAGAGYLGASLLARALDGIFGGIGSQTRGRLQAAGVIGGILKNTGAI